MSGVMTRWSIGQDRTIEVEHLDADGFLTAQTLTAWIDAAVDAYLAQCEHLRKSAAERGLALVRRPSRLPRTSLLGRPTEVLATASATEVRPADFVISVRIRPFGGDSDLPVNVTCRVCLEDPVTGEPAGLGTAVRDELIALEQSAWHMN